MFDSSETMPPNAFAPIRTKKLSWYIILLIGIGISLLFLATGWIPWKGFGSQRDPLKLPVYIECPSTIDRPVKYQFPPAYSSPSLDMHSYYPSPPPGVYYPPLLGEVSVVVQFDYELGSWVGSPSVLKLPDGTWIASMDVKVKSNLHDASAWDTQIFSSTDQGRTWTKRASIKVTKKTLVIKLSGQNLSWGSLFSAKGHVYILGAGDLNSKIRISKMLTLDKWTEAVVIVNNFWSIHTGNVGVLVTQDKVQTCIKNGRDKDVYERIPTYSDVTATISNTARDRLRDHRHTMNALFNMEYSLSEEGVMVPYGRKYAQIILRVNNEELCGLSERYIWNLETNSLHFLKLTVDPGWSSAHGFVVYDPVSKFYWMVSHYHRDTGRDVEDLSLYIPEIRTCSVDRSILGLYYNKHLTDSWNLAGFVAYSPDFAHHASYPFLVLDGDDLVFVARSHLGGPYNETTVNHGKRVCTSFADSSVTANNHNSNMVIFNRIKNFRKHIHPMMWYGTRNDNPWAEHL